MQVLNYWIGEEYKPHFDYFSPNKVDHDKGGQRVATFLIYLNDVKAGGETEFPLYYLYKGSHQQNAENIR
nr:2OG-Fe(II) oxygenase [Bacillus sp. B15-48]